VYFKESANISTVSRVILWFIFLIRSTKEAEAVAKGEGKVRAHGDGTLRKRNDGRWEGRLITGYDEKGKPKFRYFYGKRQKDVIAKMDKVKAELNFGTYIEPHKVTVKEWLDTWLDTYKKDNLRPSTYNSYKMVIRLYLKPHLGDVLLKDLQTNQIQQVLNWLYKEGRQVKKTKKKKEQKQPKGLSRRTVELTRTVIKAALDKAVEDDLIIKNPAKGTTLPKEERKKVKPFTRDDALKFLEFVEDDRLYAIYYLMFSTGLRRGEALGLKWQDIELAEGQQWKDQNLKAAKMHIERSLVEFYDEVKDKLGGKTVVRLDDAISNVVIMNTSLVYKIGFTEGVKMIIHSLGA
jgi:integrase